MNNKVKKILSISIFAAILAGVLYISHSIFAGNETKTVNYFVGQETGAVSSPLSWPFSFFIGDNITATSTKSAFFEVSGVASAGAPTISLSLGGGSGACSVSRTINSSGQSNLFSVVYDVANCINITSSGSYSRVLNVTIAGGTVTNLSSSLIITYDYPKADRNAQFEAKTIKYPSDEGTVNTSPLDFNIYIGDNIVVMKSAFFEVSGITATGTSTLSLSLGGGSSTCPVSRTITSSEQSNLFKVTYDVTNCINIPSKGTYSRSLNFSDTPANISLVSSDLVLTYEYQPPVILAGKLLYRTSGSIFSSIFDTAISGGAALNNIIWKGINPGNGARVKFQIATSNCSNGASDFPSCTTGIWNYFGPDGSAATYYEPAGPGVPIDVSLAFHNNERYFRYKITLNSTIDQFDTPVVTDVILGWSR